MKKLMVIAVVLVFITGSAYAADWDFYGSARVSTFYSKIDSNPFVAGNPDTENYEQDLNGNARIGAKVKVNDELTGHFEYGTKHGNANIRILWGEWNFGAGSLGVGQNYTPLLMPYSNQVYNIYAREEGDTNMTLHGMLYGKREAMVRLKFGNFQIAAVQPRTTVYNAPIFNGTALTLANEQPDTEVSLPNIQAKYKYNFESGHVNLAGGYQTYEVKDAGQGFDVDSYVLAVGGRFNVGKAYFKGNVWGGQNVGNLVDILASGSIVSTFAAAGGGDLDGAGLGFARWSDGSTAPFGGPEKGITDNDALAALIVAGYEIRKGLYLEAGYGYTSTELDEPGSSKLAANTYYIQSTIFLAPGVFLTPEIGRIEGDQDNDVKIDYFGIKWQINF